MSFGLLSKEQVQLKGYHPLKSVLTTFLPILMLSSCLFRGRVSIYQG